MDEEQLAHEAEPEAAQGLRREAVIAAVVEAEQIEPTDEEVLEALRRAPSATATEPEKLLERLRATGRLERVRADVASRQAVELLVARGQADQRRAGRRRARSCGRPARRSETGAPASSGRPDS